MNNYSSGYNSVGGYFSTANNSKFSSASSSNQQDNSNVWQEILSADAKFNLYRISNNSQLRTLYMRRRTQLLRDNATKNRENAEIRRHYLNMRTQLLDEKYGPIDQQYTLF